MRKARPVDGRLNIADCSRNLETLIVAGTDYVLLTPGIQRAGHGPGLADNGCGSAGGWPDDNRTTMGAAVSRIGAPAQIGVHHGKKRNPEDDYRHATEEQGFDPETSASFILSHDTLTR